MKASFSSSPAATVAPDGIGTVSANRIPTCWAAEARGGCRDFTGPYPSVPLDELEETVRRSSQHVHIGSTCRTTGVRMPSLRGSGRDDLRLVARERTAYDVEHVADHVDGERLEHVGRN